MLRKAVLFLVCLLISVCPLSTNGLSLAQDAPLPVGAFYLAADENGIIQLWRLGPEPQMLTNAAESLVDFGLNPDATSAAYTSSGQVWLQPFDGSEPVALVTLQSAAAAHPVLSSTHLAYADNGVWIMPLDGSEEPRLLVQNVMMEGIDNAYDHYYEPYRFVDEENSLILTILLWEGYTVGIIDLNSGTVQELARGIHTRALPLSDGRLLLYGNGGMEGAFDLQAADWADLNGGTVLVDLNMFEAVGPLFVEQAVETSPGTIRVFGTTFTDPATYATVLFVFDYDLSADVVVGDIRTFAALPSAEGTQTLFGPLSPDGSMLVEYVNATLQTELDPRGIVTGELALVDIESGDVISLPTPDPISSFQWGPLP